MYANTPKPPYYAVLFTSVKSDDIEGYADMADKMWDLAHEQPGFLGMESITDTMGITISYWQSLDDIKQWKANAEHLEAQEQGKARWYNAYKVRIARVERDYDFVRL